MGIFGKQAQGTLKYGKAGHKSVPAQPSRPHQAQSVAIPYPKAENHETLPEYQRLLDLIKHVPKAELNTKALGGIFGIFRLFRLIKKIFFGFAILMILISFLRGAHSDTITGTVSATIVDDIFTTSCTALSFGKVEAGSGAGTITVSPQGKITRGGNVKADTSVAKPSSCKVRGKANANYKIKAPESLTFTVSGLEEKPADTDSDLVVDNIRIISANTGSSDFTGRISAKGEDLLSIGATIHVTENTTPGLYEGFIPVTVYY